MKTRNKLYSVLFLTYISFIVFVPINNKDYAATVNGSANIFNSALITDTIIHGKDNIKNDSVRVNKSVPSYEINKAKGDSLNGDDRDPGQSKDTIPYY